MNLANFIFYCLLFVGFFLPTNSNMYIPLPGILLKVNELAFLLLPIVNLFCVSKEGTFKINKKLSRYILLYLIIVFITEFFLKTLIFNQTIGDSFRGFRIGLPFYSSIVLLYSGIRANIRTVWRILLYAIGGSVILSIMSIFVSIPIYYNMEEEDILQIMQGRIMNSNAPFGLLGLYLLFADKDKWFNKGRLVKIVSVLSIISLILAFNRTYLALLVIELFYLTYKTLSVKSFFKMLGYVALFSVVVVYFYNESEIIQRQIDKRILSIVFMETTIAESTFDNNRDMIFDGVVKRINEGYWAIGMPFRKPIYMNTSRYLSEELEMSVTDTSLINVLMRYGVVPLILFVLIFCNLYKSGRSNFFRVVFVLYFIASVNVDSLFRQNSILFLIVLYFITQKSYEKSVIHS